MMKCKICGCSFVPSGGHPIKKHKISNIEYYNTYLKKELEGICKVCGKPTKFISISNGYLKFCSKKCALSSEETKKIRKETNLKRYGVETIGSLESAREKMKKTKLERYGDENYSNREKAKQTNLEKYGVECNFTSDDPKLNGKATILEKYGTENIMSTDYAKEKIKQTNLVKYGVENPFQSEEIKEKIKQTNLEKYGVEHNTQSKQVIEQRKLNNLKKYGVDSPTKLNSIKEKTKQTNLEKYGVEYGFQSDEIRKKTKITNIERYGVDNPTKSKSVQDKVSKTCLKKYGVPWYCMTINCRNALNGSDSKINKAFEQLLIENGIAYETEFILDKYQYDFKVLNILIELNPSATHNINWTPWNKNKGIDKNYHFVKRQVAIDNGYRCICVWDWDNIEKILNFLRHRPVYAARKLKIKLVSKEEADLFLDTFHIQGSCNGQVIRIGLYYENGLVSIMTFGKPRYSKKYEWELLRYVSSANVIGGAKKLFNYFIYNYNPNSIISYCDKSKFNGDMYINLGFSLKVNGKPSCHWSKRKLHYTDSFIRQRGFDQIFGTNYGKGTSNKELMLSNGFVQVYDCGQNTYIWRKDEFI